MSQTKAQLVGGVGISTAQNVVVGSAVTINSSGINVVGVITANNVSVSSSVTASQFFGDGSSLTNTGSSLNSPSGSQRVVVTSQTSGTMTAAATDSDLTFDSNSNTLNTANLHVTGISTLGTTNGIGKVTIGIGTTALLVEGNARVTGILSVGQGTIALDGNSDNIRVGTAVTLNSSGVTAGIITATTGCIRGTITAGTATVPGTVTGGVVCATSCFSGSGSGLSNIPSAAITGLSAGGIKVCTYTSPGTFSVPPGTTTLKITATGGGANGSASCQIPNCNTFTGSGGPSALTQVKYLTVPPACSSYPVTIGGAGGDTVFGGPTVFLANGAPDPAATGKPAQADYVIASPGLELLPSVTCYSNSRVNCAIGNVDNFYGGAGAPSFYGKGGNAGAFSSLCPGCPACSGAYGAGGGGGSGGPTLSPYTGGFPGGTGSPGFMIVEW